MIRQQKQTQFSFLALAFKNINAKIWKPQANPIKTPIDSHSDKSYPVIKYFTISSSIKNFFFDYLVLLLGQIHCMKLH